MTNTVKGTMFIVPNSIVPLNGLLNKNSRMAVLKRLGIEIPSRSETPLVEIWTVDKAPEAPEIEGNYRLSNNWSDHGVALYKVPGCTDPAQDEAHDSDCLSYNWPSHFPASLFEGKKEGDTITLEGEGVQFEFTLLQLETRYAYRGSFEKVLRELLHLYYSKEECAWRDKHWAEK